MLRDDFLGDAPGLAVKRLRHRAECAVTAESGTREVAAAYALQPWPIHDAAVIDNPVVLLPVDADPALVVAGGVLQVGAEVRLNLVVPGLRDKVSSLIAGTSQVSRKPPVEQWSGLNYLSHLDHRRPGLAGVAGEHPVPDVLEASAASVAGVVC